MKFQTRPRSPRSPVVRIPAGFAGGDRSSLLQESSSQLFEQLAPEVAPPGGEEDTQNHSGRYDGGVKGGIAEHQVVTRGRQLQSSTDDQDVARVALQLSQKLNRSNTPRARTVAAAKFHAAEARRFLNYAYQAISITPASE